MLNFIRKRKKPAESSPEVPEEEEKGEIKEYEEVKNIDEIEKNVKERKEDEIMNEEKDEEEKIGEEMASENGNAIKEEDSMENLEEIPTESAEEKFITLAQAFAKEKNIEDSDLEAGIKAMKEIRDGWMSGELTTDMLALVMRGLEYEKAVKEAREAREIAGRNTQIEEKYMRPIESDGLPHLAGSNVRKNSTRISSIFDLARNA